MESLILLAIVSFLACTSPQHNTITPKDPLELIDVRQSQDPYLRLYKEGVTFYATGNEPFWNVAIKGGDSIRYTPMEGDPITAGMPQISRTQEANVIRYVAESESGVVDITIVQKICNDTMSDEKRPFNVTVRIKRPEDVDFTTLSGCGNYLADPRIHNIWAIIKLNGSELNPTDFPNGLPRLELFTREGRVLGFDGCNSFRGLFYVRDNAVYFGPMGSTLMACPNINIGAEIGKFLNSGALSYHFEKNHLLLKHGENQITLRAID